MKRGKARGREGEREVRSAVCTTLWLLYQLDTSSDPFGNIPEFRPRDFPV